MQQQQAKLVVMQAHAITANYMKDQILMNLAEWYKTPGVFSKAVGCCSVDLPEHIAPACYHLSTIPTIVQSKTPH